MWKWFSPPFWNRITFLKFYFRTLNVNLLMFCYFESNFSEKFFWKSGFSNFGHRAVTFFFFFFFFFARSVLWKPFGNGKCFWFFFLWLIYGCFRCIQRYVKVSCQNFFGKAVFRGESSWTPLCTKEIQNT